MIVNKIDDNIKNVSRYLQKNNSETVTNENDNDIPQERYLSPEKRQEIIDDLRLIWYYNGISINNKFDW